MENLPKSDAFFFITSIAVIIVAVLLVILMVYLIRLSRDIKHITETAKEETDALAGDIDQLRLKAKKEGFKWTEVIGSVKKIFKKTKRS
jgi:uncharacterized membrane protein